MSIVKMLTLNGSITGYLDKKHIDGAPAQVTGVNFLEPLGVEGKKGNKDNWA